MLEVVKMVKELESHTIINEDGELITENKKITYKFDKEPTFVKLYLDDLAKLKGLRKSHMLVLYSLLKYMNYADDKNAPQVVIINSYVKKNILLDNREIASTQTISDAVSALKKQGILKAVGRTAYLVNPHIIGKGEWRDISELRVKITDNERGREIRTETVFDDGKEKKNVPSEEIKISESVTEKSEVKTKTKSNNKTVKRRKNTKTTEFQVATV